MEFSQSWNVFKRATHLFLRGIPVYASAALCGAVAVAVLVFTQTPEYRSQVKILVIQKYTLTDSYTAAKSAEKISKDLSEVVQTSAFLDDVVSYGTVNLSDLLSLDEEEKRKAWSKKLEANVVPSTSILTLSVYDENRERAERLAQTISQVLIDQGGEYHGAPDTIALRVIDSALTSKHPVRPNILVAGLAAAIAGAAVSGAVLFLRSNMHLSFGQQPLAVEQDTMRVSETRNTATGVTQQVTEEKTVYSVLDATNFQRHINEQKVTAVMNGHVKTMPQVKGDVL